MKRSIFIGLGLLILIVAYGLLFPTKQYFSCTEGVFVNHSLIVNKYLYGAYFTLDDYKRSECTTTDRAIDCEDPSTKSGIIFNRLDGSMRRISSAGEGWSSALNFLSCRPASQIVK